MTTAQDRLNQILPSWYDLLTQWSLDGSLVAAATDALMLDSSNAKQDAKGQLQSYVSQWSAGNFKTLPQIVLLSAADISGAYGAYADSTDTIYLNQDWLLTATEDEIQKVLTEELGHFLDDQLNQGDTQGDEGALFTVGLLGDGLTDAELTAIRQEDDNITINTYGKALKAEASAIEVANSVADFSSSQGANSWRYGYYDGGGLDYTKFIEFQNFAGFYWNIDSSYYTNLDAQGGHPHGPVSTKPTSGIEHWTARRWIAESTGDFLITGVFDDGNKGGGGDGVEGFITINGQLAYSQIATNSTSAFNYSIEASLSQGDIVDFVTSPRSWDGDDYFVFTASISLIGGDITAPVFTSGNTAAALKENTGSNQVVYAAAATDDLSTVTYSIKASTGDADAFTIDANSGDVTLIGNPDFESKPSYSFTVIATDATGNSSEQPVSLAIIDSTGASFTPGTYVLANSLYKITTGLTWLDAQQYSRAYGGDLTTINDAGENAWLFNNLPLYNEVMIGLSRPYVALDDGYYNYNFDWGWSDGTPLEYTNWNKKATYPYSSEATNLAGPTELYGVLQFPGAPNPSTWYSAGGTYTNSITEYNLRLAIETQNPIEGAGAFTTSIYLTAGNEFSGNLANETTVYWKVAGISEEDLEFGDRIGQGVVTDGKLDIQHSLFNDGIVEAENFEVSVYSDAEMQHQIGSTSSQAIADGDDSPPFTLAALRGNSAYGYATAPTWSDSEVVAIAKGGHLITVNDAAENQFALDLSVANSIQGGIYLGFNDKTTPGTWVWSSGQETSYTNWRTQESGGWPEPNNWLGIEDVAMMFLTGEFAGYWNDIPDDGRSVYGEFSGKGLVEIALNLRTALPTTIKEGDGEFTIDIDLSAGTTQFKHSLVEGAQVWFVISGITEGDLEEGYSLTGRGTIDTNGNIVLDGATTAGIKLALRNDGIAETDILGVEFYSADPTTTKEDLADVQIGTDTIQAVVESTPPPPSVQWIDWISTDLGTRTIEGSFNGDASIQVSMLVENGWSFVQTDGGINYYSPGKPYESSGVSAPTTSDIVALTATGNRAVSFSSTINTLYLAFVSTNFNNFIFDKDFDIISQTDESGEAGYWGSGEAIREEVTIDGKTFYQLRTISGEPHGVIRFRQPVDSLSWVNTVEENWYGITLGIGSDYSKPPFDTGIANDLIIESAGSGTLDGTPFEDIFFFDLANGNDTISIRESAGNNIPMTIEGGDGDDTLNGNSLKNKLVLTGINQGTLDGIQFSGIENINLGSGNDEVYIMSGGMLTGLLNGGSGGTVTVVPPGGDIGDYDGGGGGGDGYVDSGGNPVTTDPGPTTPDPIEFNPVPQGFKFNGGLNSIFMNDAVNIASINGPGYGVVDGTDFLNFYALDLKGNDDIATINPLGYLFGKLSGGDGSDTLNLSANSNVLSIDQALVGDVDRTDFESFEIINLLAGDDSVSVNINALPPSSSDPRKSLTLNGGDGTDQLTLKITREEVRYLESQGTFDDLQAYLANPTGTTITIALSSIDLTLTGFENTGFFNSSPNQIAIDSTQFDENLAAGSVVASLSAVDPDQADGLIYRFVGSNGFTTLQSGIFSLDGDKIKVSSVPDYETTSSYDVTVRVSDDYGAYFDQKFTFTVNDVFEPSAIIGVANASGISTPIIVSGSSALPAVETYTTTRGKGKNATTTYSWTNINLDNLTRPLDALVVNGGDANNIITAAGFKDDPASTTIETRAAFSGLVVIDGKSGADTITGGTGTNWLIGGGVSAAGTLDTLTGTLAAKDIFDLRSESTPGIWSDAYAVGHAVINNFAVEDFIALAGQKSDYIFNSKVVQTFNKKGKLTGEIVSFEILNKSSNDLIATVSGGGFTSLTDLSTYTVFGQSTQDPFEVVLPGSAGGTII
jgi:hypothetical protein